MHMHSEANAAKIRSSVMGDLNWERKIISGLAFL